MKKGKVSNRLICQYPFEDWEIALAKGVVSDFCGVGKCFHEGDFEDLLQECLIHWWEVRNKYNPHRKASPKTYMRKVLRSKLIDLVRERKASKRKPSYNTCSLDKPLKDGEDSSTFSDQLKESTLPWPSPFHCSDIDIKVDLAKALEKLTPRQRKICQLKMEVRDISNTEISKELQISRSTIYDEIQRIRKLFEKDGF